MEFENDDVVNAEIDEYFQIGQKLNVTKLFTENEESYPSYVKDIANDSIFIDIPAKFGIRVPVYPEDLLEIAVLTESCVFSGEAIVLSVEKGNIEGLWVSKPEMLEKVQRRDYKRWEIKFPLKISIIKDNKIVEDINGECFDISGSGIAISTKYTIPHNSDLKIKLEYRDLNVDLKAKFIHTRYDVMKKVYVSGFKFIDIDRRITDKIHKFGIMFELDLRRKGLI
jgi:c-di-GMP-binding flagellar brake protein YcgR